MPSPPFALALDTSGDRSAVGLRGRDGSVFEAETDASRKHGRDLLPCIRDLLRSAGVRPTDLGLIGVGLGPGSYTGLRIGLTAARMLAYTAGARLLAFDSLEGFAQNAPDDEVRDQYCQRTRHKIVKFRITEWRADETYERIQQVSKKDRDDHQEKEKCQGSDDILDAIGKKQ